MYMEYNNKVAPLVYKYGGKYIARSGAEEFNSSPNGKLIPVEGGWNPDRMVIMKFPSREQISIFGNSPEYKAIVNIRKNSATTKSIIVNEY